MEKIDKKVRLVIIGAGPGGYAAAFYAADCGLEVVLIDKRNKPGGVCLNEGCIPSKAFLHAATLIEETKKGHEMGIVFSEPVIDISKLRDWKNSVVGKLSDGLKGLASKRKIEYIQGSATFLSSSKIEVKSDNQLLHIEFENAIIATGSVPVKVAAWPDSALIMDSTDALELKEIPESLLIIGGGYIGLEMGQFYQAFGSKITIVEMADRLLAGIDQDLVKPLEKNINALSQNIYLGTQVVSMKEANNKIEVGFQKNDSPDLQTESFDKVLVSIGRNVDLAPLLVDRTAIRINSRGFIDTDKQCRTSEPNIYAIGDVAGGMMLAHKASHEGRVAVDAILGKKTVFEPRAIPAVVFTNPEIAVSGLSEDEALKQNIDIKITRFPFAASGRALSVQDTTGFVKLILDKNSGTILGAGVCGANAGELIAQLTLAIEMGANAEDLALTIHAHPTLSESIMEAAESFAGHSTHLYTGGLS